MSFFGDFEQFQDIVSFSNRIIPQDHRRYSILEDGTLMIQGARDSDQGVYECLARNAAGEIRTNKVELRYFGDPGILVALLRQ